MGARPSMVERACAPLDRPARREQPERAGAGPSVLGAGEHRRESAGADGPVPIRVRGGSLARREPAFPREGAPAGDGGVPSPPEGATPRRRRGPAGHGPGGVHPRPGPARERGVPRHGSGARARTPVRDVPWRGLDVRGRRLRDDRRGGERVGEGDRGGGRRWVPGDADRGRDGVPPPANAPGVRGLHHLPDDRGPGVPRGPMPRERAPVRRVRVRGEDAGGGRGRGAGGATMKVAVLYDYLETVGGGERVALTLAKHLEADLITTEFDPALPGRAGFDRVRLRSLGRLVRGAPLKQLQAGWRVSCARLPGYDAYVVIGNWAQF